MSSSDIHSFLTKNEDSSQQFNSEHNNLKPTSNNRPILSACTLDLIPYIQFFTCRHRNDKSSSSSLPFNPKNNQNNQINTVETSPTLQPFKYKKIITQAETNLLSGDIKQYFEELKSLNFENMKIIERKSRDKSEKNEKKSKSPHKSKSIVKTLKPTIVKKSNRSLSVNPNVAFKFHFLHTNIKESNITESVSNEEVNCDDDYNFENNSYHHQDKKNRNNSLSILKKNIFKRFSRTPLHHTTSNTMTTTLTQTTGNKVVSQRRLTLHQDHIYDDSHRKSSTNIHSSRESIFHRVLNWHHLESKDDSFRPKTTATNNKIKSDDKNKIGTITIIGEDYDEEMNEKMLDSFFKTSACKRRDAICSKIDKDRDNRQLLNFMEFLLREDYLRNFLM
jgi:hypothetical protein